MFHVLTTKSGDVIWYPSYSPIVGYHEVARMAFKRHLATKIREELHPNLKVEK